MSELGPDEYVYLPQEMMMVYALKTSLRDMREPMHWLSEDNETIYEAVPYLEDDLNYESIGQMPHEDFAGSFNVWMLKSDTVLEETKEIRAYRWLISPSRMLGAVAVHPLVVEGTAADGKDLEARVLHDLAGQLRAGRHAEGEEYDLVRDALRDLKPYVEWAVRDREKQACEFDKLVSGW